MDGRCVDRRRGAAAALFLLGSLGSLGSLLAAGGCPAPQDAAPLADLRAGLQGRSIVLVSIDTLRADHVGSYGYPEPTTPNIDLIASEGVLFERAFAPRGHTWPSLTTLWTGRLPPRTGVRGPGDLPFPDVPWLVSSLESAGYTTAAFLANFCPLGCRIFADCACEAFGDEAATTGAIAWLESSPPGPFLLWLHLMTPHAPFEPGPGFDRFTDPAYRGEVSGSSDRLRRIYADQVELGPRDLDQLVGLYDGGVLEADAWVGRLHAALVRLGLLESSILVLTSDHGEDLYQHHRFVEHACSIYDSSLRVPLVLRLPGGRLAGSRRGAAVGLVDLVPTLLDLVGIDPPAGLDGRPFSELLTSEGLTSEGSERPGVLGEHFRTKQAGRILTIRSEHWRLVHNPSRATPFCMPPTPHYTVAAEELYDHRADPREQDNVIAAHPDVADRLRAQLLSRYPAEPARDGGRVGDSFEDRVGDRSEDRFEDDETREALRALGYLPD